MLSKLYSSIRGVVWPPEIGRSRPDKQSQSDGWSPKRLSFTEGIPVMNIYEGRVLPEMLMYKPFPYHGMVPDLTNSRWHDPEPHEDPRQSVFDFEYPEPLDPSGVPVG